MVTYYRSSIHLILVATLVSIGLLIPVQSAFAADTEYAFIWRFAYDNNINEGILDIMVVEHEIDTHDIVAVINQFSYDVPCSTWGSQIICDLDIRNAAKDAYYKLGMKDEAAKVRAGESYRWMIAETTGHWTSLPPSTSTTVANHSNLKSTVATDNSGKAFQFASQWNSHTSSSAFYPITVGEPLTMRNEFDCPKLGNCTTANYVIDSNGTTQLDETQLNISTIGFTLAPTQIMIKAPAGFQLDSFVIDPPKAGYG